MNERGGIGSAGALVLFLLVAAGLILLSSGGKLPGGGFLIPDSGNLSDAARHARETAQAAQAEAAALDQQYARQRQAELDAAAREEQARLDQAARETEAARAQTAIVEATSTAEIQQVTIEAARAESTATAAAQATAFQSTMAAAYVTQTADVLRLQAMANQATQVARDNAVKAARDQIGLEVASKARYWWAWLLLGLGAGIAFFGYRILRLNESTAGQQIEIDPTTGRARPVIRDGKIISTDLSRVPVLDPRRPIQDTGPDQLEITRRDQQLRGVFAATRQRQFPAGRGPVGQQSGAQQPPAQEGVPAEDGLPSVAPWDLTNWTGSTLPLGIAQGNTAVALIPERTPNLLIAGKSNSGKTMTAMRPLLAEALASGWQSVLANDAGGDFAPLKSHPNLTTVGDDPREIADMLDAVLGEVGRRKKILADLEISTYYRLGNALEVIGPRILVMVDELVALTQMAAVDGLSKRIWRPMIGITSQCRKTGIMVVLGTTNPTERTLGEDGLTVRDNCGRLLFTVYDRAVSFAVLNSREAINLRENQFLALLDTPAPVRGVAFHPEDEDIRHFLAAHPTPALPAPAFLTGPRLEAQAEPERDDPRVVEDARKIEMIWLNNGRSDDGKKRAMARALGVEYEGNYRARVDRAIEYLVRTANGANGANTANLGPQNPAPAC